MTVNSEIRKLVGDKIDDLLGEKYTGWWCLVKFTGQIYDMDEVEIDLIARHQGKNEELFLHKVRGNFKAVLQLSADKDFIQAISNGIVEIRVDMKLLNKIMEEPYVEVRNGVLYFRNKCQE